jgi:hypothetical protein
VRALRGRQDGFGPAPSNQALRRLIEKKKRKQETQREAEPESPHEIAIQIQKHLENDPGDTSGRMRSQLEAMEPEKRQEVVARLRDRTSTAGKERLAEVLSEPAPKAVEAPAGKPEGKKQVEEAQQEQEQEKEKLEAKTAEPPAPPAEPEPEAPEKKEEKARQEDKKKKEEKPPVAEAKAETEKAAAARVKKDRVEETRPVETPEAALEKAAKAPGIGEKKPAEAAKKPEEVLKPSPEAEAGKKPEEKALAPGAAPSAKAQAEKAAPGKAEPEKAEAKPGEAPPPQAGVPELAEQAKQKAAKAEKPTGKPSAGATEKGQAQQAEALQGMPAAARGEAGAAAPAPPGPAAQKAAAQPVPAVGGATAAEVAGGGGDGGEAALEAEPEGGPAAAEGDKATEKMDEAEPAAEEEPAPEGQEPSEPAAETAGPPSSEEKEEAKAADEQDKQIAAAGGTPDVAAPGEEEEGEEGVTASKVELPGPEKEAGLATLAEGGRGGGEPAGGGGGGGGAITEQPEPTPPDVSGAEPAAAMSSLSGLKVGAIAQAMGGVSAAISKTAGDQKQELAANPPTMERPSGSPVTRDGPISAQYPPEGGEGKAAAVEQVPEGEAVAVPEPEPVPEPGPDPTEAVAAPPVTGGEDGTMTEADAANVENAVRDMPTSDPEIETNAGPSPTLQLEGDADPQQARDQRAELDKTAADQQAQGAEDVAKPMGEDEVYPTVPKETLEGQVPAGAGGGEGGGQAAGADDETAGIVAEEKEGDAVRSSVQQASTDMAAKQQQHIEDQAEKRSDTDKEIADTVAENTSLQTEERQAAKRQVGEHRSQWSEGQQQAVDKAQTDADREGEKLDTDVAAKQEEANTKAQEEIDSGTQKAEAERQAGEAKAESEKQKAEKESDGIFGWLASKATAFFNALKKAVSAVISAMRKAVKAAIEFAKKAALAAIDLARKAIVGLIKLAGEALMAIGDVLLAAFPSLRAKFRKLIQKAVAAAEDAVNRLADGLKKAVAAALDALGAALDALLGLLEKGLLAVLDAANKVVQAAIKAAQAVIAALAAFAAIIKDVAANPGQWISNLGAAVIDGIKNHLWKAFKAAIKNWFEQKLTQILGIGMMIFQILMKGGIKLAEVGKMAFEGLKAAIPTALIGILVEKLVAMIVPAAGAVMAIIEGLQAAWGTISRILAAISKFVSFLRAVKSGTAGPRFAEMLASAAIIVIDFVANWLIKRIRGPASKIGGKVKAIARKILEKLKKIAKKIVKAVKKVIDKVKRGLKKIFGKKKKKSKKKDKRDQDKAKERLDKAVSALRPKLAAMLSNPVSSIMLRAKLAFWRLRYRIKVLSLTKSGQQASINAANSPSIEVITAVDANQELVMKIVREAGEAIMTDNKVRALAKDILKQRKAGLGTTDPRVLPMSPNIPVAATELGMAAPKPWTTTRMEMSPGGVLLPVSERQLFTSGPPSTWVIGAGKTADVQATVSELGGPKAVAAAFFAAQTGGKPTGLKGGAAGVVSFGEIMRLMAVETARDPHGELSRLTMRMSEAERGGTTAQQLVRERNPIGERGGTGTAAFISREMDHEAPGKRVPTQAEVDTFVRQELALAAQFIHSTAVVDEKIGGTVVQITNFIKKKLKDKLITLMRQKYGL